MHLGGGAETFGALPAGAPEGEDLAAEAPFGGARGFDDSLRLHFGLPDDDAGLAPRLVLHILHEALGGAERLLQHLLPLLESARALFEGLELLLAEGGLLVEGVVAGVGCFWE